MRSIRSKTPFLKKKTILWISFFVFTVGQMTALWRVDRFLASPAIPALAASGTVNGAGAGKSESFLIPSDAVQSKISPDNQYAAYTTTDHDMVLVGQGQFKSIPNNGPISYMTWLGNSDTLLYFVQGSYLDAYLLQPHDQKPLLIQEWLGDQRTVNQVFFSPYMEFLYMDLKRETTASSMDEVYKYDAVNGIKQIPLYNLEFRTIEYDDMTDTMLLTTSVGKIWKYTNGHLYSPNGVEMSDTNQAPSKGKEENSSSASGTNSASSSNSTKSTGSNAVGGAGGRGSAGSGSATGTGSSKSSGTGAAGSTGSQNPAGNSPAISSSGSTTISGKSSTNSPVKP